MLVNCVRQGRCEAEVLCGVEVSEVCVLCYGWRWAVRGEVWRPEASPSVPKAKEFRLSTRGLGGGTRGCVWEEKG